ncbi:copper amine oxidase N-terminal domain-containing protein [Paenibacillus sp. CMAA1364]
MKQMIITMIASVVVSVGSLGAYASPAVAAVVIEEVKKPDIEVLLNARKIVFPDAKPYSDHNRVMVPIRFVSEALGADVKWDGGKEVAIINDTTTVHLTIGSSVATVNGKSVTFDTSMKINKQRTYVPLRFVSEALGQVVDWDGSWVWIGSKDAPTPKEAGVQVHSIDKVSKVFATAPFLLMDTSDKAYKEVFIADKSQLPVKIGKGYGERTIKDLVLMKSGNDRGLKITYWGTPFNIFYLDQKVARYRNHIRPMDTTDAQGNKAVFYQTTSAEDEYRFGDKNYSQFKIQNAVYIGIDINDDQLFLIKNPF